MELGRGLIGGRFAMEADGSGSRPGGIFVQVSQVVSG
jgi:hypothetical protein